MKSRLRSMLLKHRLIRVLEDWTPPNPGFFMYYPVASISLLHWRR